VPNFDDGVLQIDFEQRRVVANGHPVDLAPAVYTVLTRLVRRPGEIVSDEELAGLTGLSPQRIRSVVARLRQKLGSDHPWGDEGSSIEQVSGGFGYRWRSEDHLD
jgi:two-component system KDP operon response regulator KdpE